MEKSVILYIDDDINMLNLGEDILVEAGYEVSLAKSGIQAVKLLSKGLNCDLILLDVDMPEMDGYDTFKAIRNIKGYEDIPIIFLTGMDSPDFEIKGLEMGAADYITKPFVKSVLLARVNNRMKVVKSDVQQPFNIQKLHELESILSSSELQIAKLVAEGFSNQEIAEKTNYSYGYVKKVVSVILEKLFLKNRVELRQVLKR